MDRKLAREQALLADRAEAAAFVDLFAAAPPALRQRFGLATQALAGATLLLAPGLPSTLFNRVIGLGLPWPARAKDLAAIRSRYAEAGVSHWWLHWSEAAAPAGFGEQLLAQGWRLAGRPRWAKLMYPQQPAPAPHTSLSLSGCTVADAAATAQALAQAFEMPPFMAEWLAALQGRPRWRLYALRDGEQVVGGGCLYLDGGLAWLGMGGVLPTHRGRGGQLALLARRVADAQQAGARWIVNETGEPVGAERNPSLANLRRCGFEPLASRLNLLPPASA